MRSTTLFSGLVAASLALASPIVSGDEDVVKRINGGNCGGDGQFVPAVSIGDPENGSAGPFCESSWGATYNPVTTVTGFWDDYSINGLQLTYSDGTKSPVYGGTATQYSGSISVDYAKGERWTAWSEYYIYGYGNCMNAVYVSNSKGETLYAGEHPFNNNIPGVYQDVGSGFLFGMNGTLIPGGISSLSGLFLQSTIGNIQVTDVNFPNGPTGSQNINIDTLSSSHFYNGQASGTSTWMFQNSDALATAHTFTQGVTNTYGMQETIMFSLSIPIIKSLTGSSSTQFSWSTAHAEMNAYATTKTVTVSWSEGGSLQPGQGVDASAVVGQGSGTYSYTSTVTITLQNGFKFSFPETGSLTINDVSNAIVEVATNNNP